MNRESTVTDTVNKLLDQAGLDERFRADFSKAVAAAYDAGQKAGGTFVTSAPLSDAEIALLRAQLKA